MLYLGVQKHLDQTLLSNKEISFSQFLILVGFYCKEGSPVTQAKLAESLMITEATVSRHIRVLVEKKLLTKLKDPQNKKSYNLTLTKTGIDTFNRAKKVVDNELTLLFSDIKEADQSLIIKTFSKTITKLHDKK